MRVLLDARKLGDGGIGTYLENLIRGFLHKFPSSASFSPDRAEAAKNATPFSLTLLVAADRPLPDYAAPLDVVRTSIAPYSPGELFSLGRAVAHGKYDLFHTPHYPAPLIQSPPLVVTIHDLIHLRYPESWYYPAYCWPVLLSSLLRARAIITVSEATRMDVESLLASVPLRWLPAARRARGRLLVIPNAVARAHVGGQCRNLERVAQENYLLCVLSNTKPHKGIARLIGAFSRLRLQFPSCRLVLAGYGAQQSDWGLNDRDSQLSGVEFAGVVSDERLADLYRAALGVVVASDVEGFCLPVIEAHAHGAPVVTTPIAAVQELLDGVDVCAPDFSVTALAEAMATLVSRGPIIAATDLTRWSLDVCVEKTLSAYTQAARGSL